MVVWKYISIPVAVYSSLMGSSDNEVNNLTIKHCDGTGVGAIAVENS